MFTASLVFTDVVILVAAGNFSFGVLQEDSDDKHAFVRGLAGLGKTRAVPNLVSLVRLESARACLCDSPTRNPWFGPESTAHPIEERFSPPPRAPSNQNVFRLYFTHVCDITSEFST